MISCPKCNSKDILHEVKEGRGLPPKNWVRKIGDNRKISWKGIWDIWTCKNCKETSMKLRK